MALKEFTGQLDEEFNAPKFVEFTGKLDEEVQSEPPEATISGEVVKGFKRYGSAAQTSLEAFTGDPEAAVRAGMKRQEDLIKEYGQARGLEEFKKAYGEGNYLAAGKEFLSQMPTAIAGQAGTLATMAGFGKLGSMAGSAVLPGIGTVTGATIGAGLGAIVSQLKPFFEENLTAQLRAQEERGEPIDLNRAKAAATAVLQSSAEVGGAVLAFGKRIVSKVIGSKTGDEAKEALVAAAQRSLLGSATVGAGRAVATEIPVELAQNILTRAQAGEDLTSDDAFDDYKNTIYETIKVAGPLGAGAGPINRASARGRLDEAAQQEQYAKDLAEGKTAPEQKPVTELTPEEQAELDAELAPATEKVPTTDVDIDETNLVQGQVTDPELVAMEAEYLKREQDIATGPKGAVPARTKKNAELKQKIEAKKVALAQAATTAPIVQGEQDATTAPVVGGTGVSPEVSGQPGGVPAGGVVGVDGTGVDIAGDTSQQAQGTTIQPPSAVEDTKENIADIGKMGKGITDGMYDMLWAKVEAGDTTEAGQQSMVLQAAQAVRQQGGLTNRDEFITFANKLATETSGKSGQEYQTAIRNVLQDFLPKQPTPATTQVVTPIAKKVEARKATPVEQEAIGYIDAIDTKGASFSPAQAKKVAASVGIQLPESTEKNPVTLQDINQIIRNYVGNLKAVLAGGVREVAPNVFEGTTTTADVIKTEERVTPRQKDTSEDVERQSIAKGLAQDRAEEAAVDAALAETKGQKLPTTKLPDIENFQEEYDLARDDLAKREVIVPEWKNLKADEKDFFLAQLPTNPSATDYTNALENLAEYKDSTGRGEGYGGEKVTPTQRRIINGYNEARADAYKKYNVNFPQWDSLSPEAQKAYTDIVTSNAPSQQDAGLKAVQQVLQTQGISIISTARQQQKQSEATAQQRAQQEDEKNKAKEAEAVGKGKPLNKDMRQALEEGGINGVLGIIANEGRGIKTPKTNKTTEAALSFYAKSYGKVSAGIFRFLAGSLSRVKFNSTVVLDVNDPVIQRLRTEGKLAEYDPKTDTFYFTPEGMDEATVLHEIVHAGTVKLINQYLTNPASLSQGQRDALDHLQKIFNFTKGRLGGKYKNAFENLYEFVSYALTDLRFQGELANIQSRNLSKYTSMAELGPQVRNVWGEITRALANLYGLLTGKGKTIQVRPELIGAFSEGMSPTTRQAMYEDVDSATDADALTTTEVGDFVPGKQTEIKDKKERIKVSNKALLSREKGFEGNLLLEVSEIFEQILTVPEAGVDVAPLAAKVQGAQTTKPTTKKVDEVPKVYKTVLDLDNPDPEFALEKTGGVEPRKKFFEGGLQGVYRRWQNAKQPIRNIEEALINSGLANFEGDDINALYTAYTLGAGNAVMLAKEQVSPATERLHKAFDALIKKTGWDRKTALEKLHMITAAMHEGERRQVKYLLQVPLSNDGRFTLTQGGKQITPADRRNQIVKILETRKLSKEQAQQLRAELESIVEKYKDPLGYSPRREKSETDTAVTGPMSVDPNGAEYVVTGMSPESAAAIKQQYEAFEPEVKGMIDSIRSNVRQLNDATRNLNSQSGFWSAPVNNFANFYGWENYVPFKTSLSQDERLNYDSKRLGGDLQDSTQGFDGSFEVSDNPILRTMSDAFRAAARAGRKDYTLSVKNAVKQKHISGDIKTIKFEDRNTDLPLAKKQNAIFHYNQDGSVDVVTIKDPVMLNSIRRMYKERQPLVEMMNHVTSFIGQTHTRYNYAFAPMNFVRDILTNSFVLGADFSPREAARFIGVVSSKVSQNGLMKAAKIAYMFENNDAAGIKRLLNDKNADAFSRQIAEYLTNGGMISYTESLSLKSRFEALEKEIGQKGLKNKLITSKEGLDKFVDIWNNMFELTSRAAAYGVVKQRVMNKENLSDTAAQKRAAAYVKNLANFELAGEYGRVMGALFMFFRPAATGAVRAIEAITPAFQSLNSAIRQLPPSVRNNPEALAKFKTTFNKRRTSARIMMATLMSTGYGMYMMSAMMAPEDELERNSVLNDNMAQWTRYARFHIPNEISEKYLGGAKDVVFQIPWGFGLGAFAAAGSQVAGAMSGKSDTKDLLKNVFTNIALDSFVPIPVSRMDFEESPMNFIIDSMMPSFARPVVQFALNKDGLGRGIYNESYRRMVDAYTGGDRIPEIWKDAARYIIEATDGKLDLSPNALYFMTNSYIDGFSRVFETAYGVKSVGSGEKGFNPKTDLILFNSFFGAKGNVDNKEFAEMQQKMLKKQNVLNGFKESNPAKYLEYVQENPMDQPLVDAFNKLINGDLRKLQSEAKKIRSAPTEMLTPKERKEMLEPNLLMQRLIKRNILDMFNAYEGKG